MNWLFLTRIARPAALALFLSAALLPLWAQNSAAPDVQNAPTATASLNDSVQKLSVQLQRLETQVDALRAESARLRGEVTELREELNATHGSAAATAEPQAAQTASPPPAGGTQAQEIKNLQENYELLGEKVNQHEQTKVESASRYKVRLSGIVLFNLFNTRSNVDNLDFPSLALPPFSPTNTNGGFGGTLRQSELGLDVFGPTWLGARTSADVQFDFAGGFPATLDGTNFGLVRLRTGNVHLDWTNTSVVAGQDALFFSPESPTSLASLAVPALAYAGNLWSWVPQLRVEHEFSAGGDSNFKIQAGVLDGLTGETPPVQFYRTPVAGESSHQPAYATRLSWNQLAFGRPLTLGVAGYFNRQDWGFARKVDGWAGMADMSLPLSRWLELSGKFYRGVAVGGLGGGAGRSVVFNGPPDQPTSSLHPLRSLGGWGQIKFRVNSKLDFNAAAGQDNPFAADLRNFYISSSDYPAQLDRNRTWLVNFIYRPRSDLLFSTEYRRLRTFFADTHDQRAQQIDISMGVLF